MGVNGHWYVEIKKQAFWRGNPHTWVNRYILSGSQPSGSDAETVISALHDIEDQMEPAHASGAGIGFVIGSAYPSGSGGPFAVVPYNTSEGAGSATGFSGAGWTDADQGWAPTLETCMMMETPITGLNSRGKPISLRKYFRGVMSGGNEAEGTTGVTADDITGSEAVCLPWKTGMGSSNWVVIAPSGAQASGPPVCHPFLVNHQIPRGRKRKPASSGSGFLLSAAEKALLVGAGYVLETA